jgi:imidazolonepropionase-like amidohydrolase
MKIASLLIVAVNLQAQTIILRHANLIDGVSESPIRDVTVIARDGKIAGIEKGETSQASSALVLDVSGKWVLPGYVDTHVHISNLRDARRALESGATTVRSMGVSNYADVGIRELHRKGMNEVPDVIASGYHVWPHPAEELFLNLPELADLFKGVQGTANVRRLVKANVDHGAQVIKVVVTERAGTPDTDPRKRLFTDEEIAAVVDEAKSRGVPVAAHAHGEEGAAAAIRAGVHSIEHGTYLSDATLQEMKKRGTFLVPTMSALVDMAEKGGDYDDPFLLTRGRHMLPRLQESVRHAQALGVRIIAGTDTSYGPRSTSRISQEIVHLVGAGLSPIDAIKASTSLAAECLGIGSRTGSLQIGKEADIVVIDGDPLAHITALQDVLLVINDGSIVVNRLK